MIENKDRHTVLVVSVHRQTYTYVSYVGMPVHGLVRTSFWKKMKNDKKIHKNSFLGFLF